MARRKKRKADPGKAVAYLRRSKDEHKQKYSFDAQRTAINQYAEAEGIAVLGWHEDDGVSGGADLDRRVGLLAAIDALETHNVGVLLVWKRDRLARDMLVALLAEQMAERVGAEIFTTEGDNGEGVNAVLLRGIKDLLAQHERLLIRSRTKAALAVKKRRGERLGRIPFGHRAAADGVHLESNPKEQRVLDRIRSLREGGATFQRIVDVLNNEGVAPPRARKGGRQGTRWHLATVHGLLTPQNKPA